MKKISNTLGSNLDEFKDKTIMITGANGLIGGFLSDFFMYLNDEHNFNCKLVLTSLSDHPKRLGNSIYRKDVQYHSRDLTQEAWFFDEIDFCIYCAGYAQPNKFLSDAEKTYQLNVDSMARAFQSVMFNRKKSKMLK